MSNITMQLALELKLEEKTILPGHWEDARASQLDLACQKNDISKVGFATIPNNKLLGGGIHLSQQLPKFGPKINWVTATSST
jgi:hypothetical protein